MSTTGSEKVVALPKSDEEGQSDHEHHELDKTSTRDISDNIHIHNELAYKGDDSDGRVEWTFRTAVAATSLSALFAGSQIPLYFTGGSLAFIEAELGFQATGSWLTVSYTLAATAVAPFTGYLQDLLGRRQITLLGSLSIMVGAALTSGAHSFGMVVAGMVFCGAGAAICELSALAGMSDIVPVRQRGIALGLLAFWVLPFAPYVLYAQLLSTYHTWRWGLWITLIWNAMTFVGLATSYFPHSHPRMEGLSKRRILARIDYIGAILSITGITLLLVALQAGGYHHTWTSAYVLAQLFVGVLLILIWIIWEVKYAKFPMIPKEVFQGQKIVAPAFFVAFVAGINFYSVLNFFPLSFSAVYNPDPIQVGLKGLGYGFAAIIGSIVANSLISTRIPAKLILAGASILMTVFGGLLVIATPQTPELAVAVGTIACFGIGGIISPSATVALIVVPDTLLATTAALSLSIRTIGGSIGFAVYYNVFVNKLTKALPEKIAQFAVAAGLPEDDVPGFVTAFLTSPSTLAHAPGYSPEIAVAAEIGTKWAYSYALKYVWLCSIPFGVLAVIACCLLPSIKKYQTNRIAVSL